MQFHANFVHISISGDYCQALFEENEDTTNPDSPYLLIQRQFEDVDNGLCYVETLNADYAGHFRLSRLDFRPDAITIDIDQSNNRSIQVTLSMQASEFENALPVLNILSGKIEPCDEEPT
jgi:hypothetical protein